MRLKSPKVLSALSLVRSGLAKSFVTVDAESNERMRKGEIDKYNKPKVVFVVAISFCFVVYGIIQVLTPPEDIAITIRENSAEFISFSDGAVSFTDARFPFQVDPVFYPIQLPDRNLQRFKEFTLKSLWYEFKVAVPKDRFIEGQTGLLVPKIWGWSEVYVNGQKVDFGKDIRPIIGMKGPALSVLVHVRGDNPFKFGIRATYPLVVGDISKLREIAAAVDQQVGLVQRVLVSQLIIAALFIVLFVMLPSKPELLTFVLFFSVSLAYGYVLNFKTNNQLHFFPNFEAQMITLLALDFARAFLLFRFVMEFFRMNAFRVRRLSRDSILIGIFVVPSAWYLLRSITVQSEGWGLWGVVQQSYFMIWTVIPAGWVCSYLILHLRYWPRATVGLTVLGAATYTFTTTIYDYWLVNEKITGEFRNHLVTYFIMAGVIALEFARTERDKKELAGNLPREQREKFLKRIGSKNAAHTGFVLLVDGVGFSDLQEKISTSQQGLLTEKINQHLMGIFGRLEGASILNGTGDGFYFAWEGRFSLETLNRLIDLVTELFEAPLSLGDGNEMRFRCALGFGSYFVGMSSGGGLKRDYSAGVLLTQLARIIGSESSEQRLRALYADEFLSFAKDADARLVSIEGKRGAIFSFYEFAERDLRSLRALKEKKAA